MVITLWASFIEWQVNPLIKTTLINGNASMGSFAIVLILALLIAWLTKKLPSFANSILSGQSTLSGGELYDAVKKGSIAAAAVITGGAVLAAGAAGGTAAGAMGAAEGAAGSSGAGAMGASQAGGAAGLQPAGSSEAGSMQAAKAVPPPAPQPEAKSSAVMPPAASVSQPSAGVQPPASQTSSGTSAPPAGQSAAPGGQAASSGSGQTSPGTSTPQTDAVDHRPAAPNAPAGNGTSGGKPVEAPKEPSVLDQAKDAMQKLHSAHDALSIGKPSSAGVSAPSLGVKHLSD